MPRRDSASAATPVAAEGHVSGGGDDSLVDAQVGSCVLEIMTTVNVERHSVLHQEHADGFEQLEPPCRVDVTDPQGQRRCVAGGVVKE